MYDDAQQRSVIEADDWIFGAPDAPVVLLEYGDYECPYCAAARPALEGLVADNPEALRLAYRHFPLTATHPHALTAAEAAEAAGAQGRFWEMHDLLYKNQRRLEYERLLEYAGRLDLDLARFTRELSGRAYLEEVRRDFRRGIRDGVNGTPTILINGRRYDGPRDRASLLAAIYAQLAGEAPALV
jgi:protein-disulfide isomerase